MKFLLDHLWQSTIFAAVVPLFAFALRRNRAWLRHWLWLTASVKFLIPFAAVVSVGRYFTPRTTIVATPQLNRVVETVNQSFSPTQPLFFQASSTAAGNAHSGTLSILLAAWLIGSITVLLAWWIRWRRVAAVIRQASPVTHGREWESLQRLEKRLGTKPIIPLVSSTDTLEPGIFGILRPILFWPRHMTDCLSDGQIDAIMTHEISHVRRRDNLWATLHMLVEAVFWFHPAVWLIGKQLVDERERACDEEVIRLGSAPQVYAESILKTCEFSVESPLASVAGVTGSDLNKRIEQIMCSNFGTTLNVWKKSFLAIAGVTAIAVPFLAGVAAPLMHAQAAIDVATGGLSFEVASVKSNKSGSVNRSFKSLADRFEAMNVPLLDVIAQAYGGSAGPLPAYQIIGGVDWMNSDRFDVIAKASGDVPEGESGAQQRRLMLRALLVERFKLVVHKEIREVPIYSLVLARADGRLGTQLRRSDLDCVALLASFGRVNAPPPTPPQLGQPPPCGRQTSFTGNMRASGQTMLQLANSFSQLLSRVVLDRTGLAGGFDVELHFNPEGIPGLPAPRADRPASDNPSIFTAVQDQLGLKLESTKGPVDVLVIDRAEQPTPD